MCLAFMLANIFMQGIQINRANRSCCTYTIKQIKEAHIKDDGATFIIDNKEAMDVSVFLYKGHIVMYIIGYTHWYCTQYY